MEKYDAKYFGTADAILPDGTPLYFKTHERPPEGLSIQLELYSFLLGYGRAMDKEE